MRAASGDLIVQVCEFIAAALHTLSVQKLRFVRAVFKCFPQSWVEGMKMPWVEDLVNASPFCLWRSWLAKEGILEWAVFTEKRGPPLNRSWLWAKAGHQLQAHLSKRALAPVIDFGQGHFRYFQEAMSQECQFPMPWMMGMDHLQRCRASAEVEEFQVLPAG